MIVGLDIGGHHVAGALVDEKSSRFVASTYRHVEVDRGASKDRLLDAWASLIDEIAATSAYTIGGVGAAMPGPFDYANGVAYFEGNKKFESLYGVDVGKELKERCGYAPEFRFLNDATAFAVGCAHDPGTLLRYRLLALTLGTGLGSAFLDHGIPVISNDDGRVPPHGSLWHLPFKDSIADDYVSSRWLLARGREVLGPQIESVAEIAASVRATRQGREVFEEYGANLASIIAPWIEKFSSEVVILGGRITKAFDLFSASLESGLAAAGATRPVVFHESTEDAAILGAAACFNEDFWGIAKSRLPSR